MKPCEALGVVLVAWAAVGCESTCEEAQEKFEGCKDEIREAHMGRTYSSLPYTGVSEECNEVDECEAECILESDCASMARAIGGGQADPNVPPTPGAIDFGNCVVRCADESSD